MSYKKVHLVLFPQFPDNNSPSLMLPSSRFLFGRKSNNLFSFEKYAKTSLFALILLRICILYFDSASSKRLTFLRQLNQKI